MDDALKFQGIQAYDDNMTFFRGKTVKVVNTNPPKKVKKNGVIVEEQEIQRYGCDGEDLQFRSYVKYETLPGELEVIVDFDYIMMDKKQFSQARQ